MFMIKFFIVADDDGDDEINNHKKWKIRLGFASIFQAALGGFGLFVELMDFLQALASTSSWTKWWLYIYNLQPTPW